MQVHRLFACSLLSIWITISAAQTKTTTNKGNESTNASRGFVQFNSDGKTFGMNAEKETEINMTTELRFSGVTTQLVLALYTKPASRDTILLYLYDNKGLVAGNTPGFSPAAKLIFVYKLYGKGNMVKSLDNAKGEINAANYIRLTTLEAKPGGTVEGVFSFTDIPFKNNTGKIVAKIKGVSEGHFKTQVTQYNEIKGNNATGAAASQEPGKLSPEANLLFKNVKCKLTDFEKNEVAHLTGFILSGKADEPFAMDKESKDYPYTANVTITDMNKDGAEEVFIQYGNTFTSGNTGQSIVLFIKDKQGAYHSNLNFPGVDPEQLKTGFGGYPDLLIGGPGFNFPIWRWNGNEYTFYKTKKQP